MDVPSIPWFQFMIDDSTRQRVCVPIRITEELQSNSGEYFLVRGDNNGPCRVNLRLVEVGHVWKSYIVDGWANYLVQNDIRNGDVVEMFYLGSRYLRPRIYRNGNLVGEVEDDIDDDNLDYDPPLFTATFTKHYIRSGRLYVPVCFARENVTGYPEETPVQVVMGRHTWDATMTIKYDVNREIKQCLITRGVKGMMYCENIRPGHQVLAEFFGNVTPPLLYVRWHV